MIKIIRKLIDLIFFSICPIFLSFYENHIFFRLRRAWGVATLRRVKNRGRNVRIHGRCTIIKPEYLILGDHVRIGNNCYFFCIGGIHVGDNVQLSRNITIYASNHNHESTTIPYDPIIYRQRSYYYWGPCMDWNGGMYSSRL